MTRTYRKNILRTFTSARSRFVAIFSIVALGVGFLAGLNATPLDMKESMEQYLDDGNFYDLRVVSSMGLTDDDVEALRQVDGVQQVQPGYSTDLLVDVGDDVIVSRAQSLPPDTGDAINRLVLADGRLPQNSGECVVEASANLTDTAYPIGTRLTIDSENEDLDTKLSCTEYTIVGIVHNTNYFSFEREPASVGNGTVNLVMYLLPEDFAYDTYTEIYLTAQGARDQNSMGDSYAATVEALQTAVESIQEGRCQSRYDEIVGDAQQEIDDAWTEYYDAEAEARQELDDAAKELEDGRQELEDGRQEYLNGEQEYADGANELAENEAKVNDGAVQLEEGRQELLDNQKKIEDGEAELAANEPTLAEARRKLESGQADYEAGLQQYNDALAQLENGEQQLKEGKAQLDAAEAQYSAGIATLVAQLNASLGQSTPESGLTAEQIAALLQAAMPQTPPQETPEATPEPSATPETATLASTPETAAAGPEEPSAPTEGQTPSAAMTMTPEQIAALLQTDTPTASLTLTEEQVKGFVNWLIEKEYAAPASYDELLDRADAYAEESYGLPAGALPLTSTARTVQQQAGKLLYALQQSMGQAPTTQQLELAQQLTALVAADRSAMADTLQDTQAWLDAQTDSQDLFVLLLKMLVPTWQHYLTVEQQQTQPLVAGFAQTVEGRRTLDDSWAAYEENEQKLVDGRRQLEESAPQLEDAKRQLDEGWAQYREGLAEYEAGKRELADGRRQLEEGWATLTDKQVELADARQQIADAKAELADARTELDDARRTIAENAQKLRDGEIEYEDAKAEAEQELADARAEIQDAEQEVADIDYPEWYIWDRDNNVSYSSFVGNVDKLTAITTIFPVFFFLVAALVVSTTMTRMVEEERLQIGTLKALGYTRGEIMQKYLWYAFAAAITGTLVGLAVGFQVFPSIIWSAYAMMYYMPAIATPWRLTQAVFAGGTLTVLTVGVTVLACRASLMEVPAALMLPRAPKAGKRILLERITPLWRRFPFSWKVTCRNLLRYQKRFWMTVIGVAGCTSLLVAGFGISDSLNEIITKQFGLISHYDLMTIVTKEEATQQGPVYDYLFGGDTVSQSLTISMETTRQETPEGEVDVYLMVPQDVTQFADFLDLHERIGGKPTPLGEDGVVLTEKLAKTLGVQAGDTVTLENGDEKTGTFTVSGVCEHYVSNYVYMSAATYAAGFGEEVSYNAILSKLTDDSQQTRNAVSTQLLEMDNVASLTFTEDSITQVLNMLNSIDAVVVLIIVCAACLAFVVLYNLSNINIAERVKEIATIKVLGFYDREVFAYVNRESMALSLIGTLFGVFGGMALHRFIIVTVEVDAVMFGRDIHPLSFVYAIALTLLFSTLVNLVMGRTLKKISMVESMKAPE